MRKLIVFNQVSLDGFIADVKGDMSWAHKQDAEWNEFVQGNASSGNGELIFGRVTYQMMASFWPTSMAAQLAPAVAERMNQLPKVVFSRTMDKASWNNTTLVTDNIAAAVRNLKSLPGDTMVIFGSGTIISELTEERLIDEYQFVVNPIVLGKGKAMFDGITGKLRLRHTNTRNFGNGNVVLSYELAD